MELSFWKRLIGFKNFPDNRYLISQLGEVREAGSFENLHQKIANKKNHPYRAVYLHNIDGKGEWVLVHQLVAFCFCLIDERYNGLKLFKELVPDHLDNNGLNNHYKNLEWKTRSENAKKAIEKREIDLNGDKNWCSIITNDEAEKICEYLEKGYGYDEIIKKMKFENDKSHRTLLVRIKNKIAWKEISDKYNFDNKTTKYNKKQLETISHIPKIISLHNKGLKTNEIVEIIWGKNLTKTQRLVKMSRVRDIVRGRIYKEILQGSSTRES